MAIPQKPLLLLILNLTLLGHKLPVNQISWKLETLGFKDTNFMGYLEMECPFQRLNIVTQIVPANKLTIFLESLQVLAYNKYSFIAIFLTPQTFKRIEAIQ